MLLHSNKRISSIRTDIPLLIGTLVSFKNLKTTSLNGETGLVVAWDNNRERFQVSLARNGSFKFFKPANLQRAYQFRSQEAQNFYKFMNSNEVSNIEKGNKLFSKISNLSLTHIEMFLKFAWTEKLCKLNQFNPQFLKTICKILKHMIKNCDFPDIVSYCQYGLASVFFELNTSKDIEKSTALLKKCAIDHYGNILRILSLWVLMETEIEKFTIDLIFQAKTAYMLKLYYRTSTETFFLYTLNWYLDTFGIDESLLQPEIWEEIEWFHENLTTQFPETNDHFSTLANYAFLKGNFENALEKANAWQAYATETYGTFSRGLSKIYKLKIKSYAKLRNKTMARKCLKQFKKFLGRDDDRYLEMKTLVDNIISSKGQKKVAGQVKTLSKCSYFSCKKKEKEMREFLVCGKCRLAKYCSPKCQALDWKNGGHKQECQRDM